MSVTIDRYVQTSGEDTGSAVAVAYESTLPKGVVEVTSFLSDRPPQIVEDPEEEAEIRWGKRSSFQYDSTVGDFRGVEDFVVRGSGSVKVGGLNDDEEEEDLPEDSYVLVNLQEYSRETQVVRVTGNDGESYVDIARIKNITFELPARTGPTGTVREFWRFNLNWR